jgi:AcrR family transcriptional regulator
MRRNPSQHVPSTEPAIRQRIVAMARKTFFAQGFRSVTMDDLARELGMSKKTLYAQFRSKRALLEAMILDKFRAVETDLAPITSAGSTNFAGALQRMLACLHQHIDEVKPPFLRDIQRECPELFAVVEGRRRGVIQRYLGKLLAEGRRAGLVRRDVPLPLIMEILLAAVQAIVNPSRLLELGLTPNRGLTAVISVVLGGALAREGEAVR